MLPKEEMKALNLEFWNEFKTCMKKHISSNGRRINWLSYPSDVKHVYIRLQADKNGVCLCLDFQHRDEGIRTLIWDQMIELKVLLDKEMPQIACWEFQNTDSNGLVFSRIFWEDKSVNFYNKSDWTKMHSFMKTHIIAFDRFYQEYKEILINLTD